MITPGGISWQAIIICFQSWSKSWLP